MRASVLLLLLLTGCGGCGLTEAAHLLRDATSPAADLREGVTESIDRKAGERVRMYQPDGAAQDAPVVVLVAGAVEDGIDDPRFVALARALARRGLVVATPDLLSLRLLRIDAEDPARIARVAASFTEAERVSLAGVSVGGSYCLIAAGRAEVRDRIACVLSFGAYAHLELLLRGWLTAPPPDAKGVMDPLGEGRRAVLQGNRDRIPPALYDTVVASNAPLSKEQAHEALAGMADDLQALTPLANPLPRARVFLLHGKDDPIVPSSEAVSLERWYTKKSVRHRLLVTDLFAHVDRDGGDPGVWESMPLLRFVSAFLSAAR